MVKTNENGVEGYKFAISKKTLGAHSAKCYPPVPPEDAKNKIQIPKKNFSNNNTEILELERDGNFWKNKIIFNTEIFPNSEAKNNKIEVDKISNKNIKKTSAFKKKNIFQKVT